MSIYVHTMSPSVVGFSNTIKRLTSLYVVGNIEGISRCPKTYVGVVGSRSVPISAAEATGKWVRGVFANSGPDLAFVVGVSQGVERIAAEAALDCGAKVLCILPCSIDIALQEHGQFLERVAQGGYVVSAFEKNAPASSWRWALRNRMFVSLCHHIGMPYAESTSGCVRICKSAHAKGKKVWAMQGSVGCNTVITRGFAANIDMTQSWSLAVQSGNGSSPTSKVDSSSDTTDTISTSVDAMCRISRESAQVVMSTLGKDLLRGTVVPEAGGRFLCAI